MGWKIHPQLLRVVAWPFRSLFRGFLWITRKTDGVFKAVASRTEKSGIYRFLRSLEAIAIVTALVLFWFELGDREVDRHNRAWSLIASVSDSKNIGNAGLGNALEILNNDGISLKNIHLSGAWLETINLSGANLEKADLSGANFTSADLSAANLGGANLSGANLAGVDLSAARLTNANLTGAILIGANLSGAGLFGADLSGTTLTGADFSGANLNYAVFFAAKFMRFSPRTDLSEEFKNILEQIHVPEANLSGANLTGANFLGAIGLTQAQIDSACYRKEVAEVFLPSGFRKPPECPDHNAD